MRISGLRITNFGRFLGEHELDLKSGVYAIVAENIGAPDRSNWSGKTTLLAAIRWALYGDLGDAWRSKDDAISHGERDMGVDLELTDGSFITRTKRRGESVQTRLIVTDGARERELAQDQAQDGINKLLGMGLVDFDATVWMGQKSMDRLMRSDPAERTRIIVDWFGLSKLEKAAEIVAKKYDETRTRAQVTTAKIEATSATRAQDRATLVTSAQHCRAALISARATIAALAELRRILDRWDADTRAIAAADAADAAVKALEEQQPKAVAVADVEAARTAYEAARTALAKSKVEVQRLASLGEGRFDGKCPVICDLCPAADQVVAAKK
jgi:DNA repair exonuclease SbcCD ATPase subunit